MDLAPIVNATASKAGGAKTTWALFFGIAMIMLANGLQGSLIGIRASLEGYSSFTAGIIMTGYYSGFLAGAYFAPKRIKNVGQKRADFVRVVSNLFTQTTKPAGQDSVFVKGSRMIYKSGVIADTALEPGQTATYNFPVKIKNRRKVQYHTMDIHWNSSD